MSKFNTNIYSLYSGGSTRNYDTIEIPLFNCREISFESCGRSQPSKEDDQFYNYTSVSVLRAVKND